VFSLENQRLIRVHLTSFDTPDSLRSVACFCINSKENEPDFTAESTCLLSARLLGVFPGVLQVDWSNLEAASSNASHSMLAPTASSILLIPQTKRMFRLSARNHAEALFAYLWHGICIPSPHALCGILPGL
jgi:hypothetical protein